jgi:hypothetical protein
VKLAITVVYSLLLAWGFYVGAYQIYQGFRKPETLLNPLFSNRIAITLFTIHIVVVTLDLFVIGPWAIANKSTFWYWGGRVALLNSSLPIAAFFNRNPQSFGTFIGRWVTLRNFFEYGIHVVFAALPVDWFRYYLLLWWLVAYRYLDVGPRRALQKLYNTPEKRARRPWGQYANWAVITAIYILAFVVVYYRQVLFATVPGDDVVPHVVARWEIGVVVGVNFALALVMWIGTRKYIESRSGQSVITPDAVPVGSH